MKRKGDNALEQIDRKREKRRLIHMQIDDYIAENKLPDTVRCRLETLAKFVKDAVYASKEADVAHQVSYL